MDPGVAGPGAGRRPPTPEDGRVGGPADGTLGPSSVGRRLAAVRERIAAAGGEGRDITIVAVTKGFSADAVEAARAVGLTDVGESYPAELEAKRNAVADPDGCRWHFLGRIQRRPVRRIAGAVHLWQAVDRVVAGEEIARRAPGAQVLVQVNVSGEARKHGCDFAEAPALVERLSATGLDVRGLMAVGPQGPPERARPGFRRLVTLADELGLPERSMGMSSDLEVAVAEGTTMVRVGRALFGPRPHPGQVPH